MLVDSKAVQKECLCLFCSHQSYVVYKIIVTTISKTFSSLQAPIPTPLQLPPPINLISQILLHFHHSLFHRLLPHQKLWLLPSSNVKLLLDQGMNNSKIAMLFRIWPKIYSSSNLLHTVEELKQLGFNSSNCSFGVALLAKRSLNKTRWDHKVETFKKWGWSDEHILHAFKKHPTCMLSSTHQIDAVVSF
jgi:hypothetical protein